MKAATAISLLLLLLACRQEHPVTRRDMARNYQAQELIDSYRITAMPTKQWYFEEEPVRLAITIDTLAISRSDPFDAPLNYQKQVALWRGFRNVSKELWNGNPIMTDAGTPYLDWSDPDGDGVMLLTLMRQRGAFPTGSYEGFLDLWVTSNWFEFEVRRLPEADREFYERVYISTQVAPDAEAETLFVLLNEIEARGFYAPLTEQNLNRVLSSLANRKVFHTVSVEDSGRFVDFGRRYVASKEETIANLYGIEALLEQLAERRGEYWTGRAALGAYVQEIGDSTLYQALKLNFLTHTPVSLSRSFLSFRRYAGPYLCGPREVKQIEDDNSPYG